MTIIVLKFDLMIAYMALLLEPGKSIRSEFPIFGAQTNKPLCFLDSAASSLKPRIVIDRMANYLGLEHANIHRGAYQLSSQATINYELARGKLARFLNAKNDEEIIFTKGATESINLVAGALWKYFAPGDVILLSLLEHHSNIVPWQILANRCGLKVDFVDISADGALDLASLRQKLKELKPKLVSLTCVSNAIGTNLPLTDVVELVKASGAKLMLDACQAAGHMPLDVQLLNCDFLAFSGHKIYGPTGIGVLYVKENNYVDLEPYQGGGDMISQVTIEGSTWAEAPRKFEAGTPPIAEAIGLGVAVDFIQSLGFSQIMRHDRELFEVAFEMLRKEPGVTLYGPANVGGKQTSILSFNVTGVHPHDFATVADSFNVQVRAGHHCALPLLKRLGLQATARASLGVYNCREDFETLLEAIRKAYKMFR